MEKSEARNIPDCKEFEPNLGSWTWDRLTRLWWKSADVPHDEITEACLETTRALQSGADREDRSDGNRRSFSFIPPIAAWLSRRETAAALPAGYGATNKMEPLSPDTFEPEYKPNRYEEVLQQLDTGVAIFDSRGVLRFLNAQMARFLNTPREAVIGVPLRRLFFHRQLPRLVRRMMVRMIREMTRNRCCRMEFQTECRCLLVDVTRVEELDGDYLVSAKDVSDFKLIEQSALQNDKLAMLGKIAAAIAHEIRNPLTAIRGFIQLLTPYLEEKGKQDYARVIMSEIDRANHIIYEFLNSSKPSAPTKQPVRVDRLLEEFILLTESEANMKGCELTCHVTDTDMVVDVDVKQIKQVLLNIFRNALDAIQAADDGRKGRIGLTARRDKRHVLVTVRDNGKGMDPETVGRLFDPFFTTKKDGTGLGLSVSYRIIRNHGGTIHVDSVPGEGTEFTICLPLNLQATGQSENAESLAGEECAMRSEQVL